MKESLINKVLRADFEKTLKKKGYAYFTNGQYNLNIIGVRADNSTVINKFDDYMVVEYKSSRGKEQLVYSITTEPGLYYMKNKLGNSKGTAILVPGQYRGCWQIGKHNGKYKALVQCKPVKVYRDGNKDNIYDLNPQTIDNGLFGINIHRSNESFTRDTIDMYSAGCQVFNNPSNFKTFIEVCEKQRQRFGNSFTYTLINEKDLK